MIVSCSSATMVPLLSIGFVAETVAFRPLSTTGVSKRMLASLPLSEMMSPRPRSIVPFRMRTGTFLSVGSSSFKFTPEPLLLSMRFPLTVMSPAKRTVPAKRSKWDCQ